MGETCRHEWRHGTPEDVRRVERRRVNRHEWNLTRYDVIGDTYPGDTYPGDTDLGDTAPDTVGWKAPWLWFPVR